MKKLNKPTEEQITEFWKLLGWGEAPGIGLISPNGEDYVPPLDLNSLFKYAVPKLSYWTISQEINTRTGASVQTLDYQKSGVIFGETPALALFWAIYRVIGK